MAAWPRETERLGLRGYGCGYERGRGVAGEPLRCVDAPNGSKSNGACGVVQKRSTKRGATAGSTNHKQQPKGNPNFLVPSAEQEGEVAFSNVKAMVSESDLLYNLLNPLQLSLVLLH